MSKSASVFDGGVYLQPVLVNTESRPDAVDYGACRNGDNGFSIWVNAVQNVPQIFYVHYAGEVDSVILEGQQL